MNIVSRIGLRRFDAFRDIRVAACLPGPFSPLIDLDSVKSRGLSKSRDYTFSERGFMPEAKANDHSSSSFL
jgi:hypothetical protein